jgi:phosphate transport system permease protein
MTDVAQSVSGGLRGARTQSRLKRRHAAERRFKFYGIAAIAIALLVLIVLLATIVRDGSSAFVQSDIKLEINFDPEVIDPEGTRDPATLSRANYTALVKHALERDFPDVTSRKEKRNLTSLVSSGAGFQLRQMVLDDPSLIGTSKTVSLPLSDDADMFLKGYIDRGTEEAGRRVDDAQINWLDELEARGQIETVFNFNFFTHADSREPELAGIWGAVVGSFLTMIVTLALSFPLAVMTAVYLEEFAPKNRIVDIIEVNINNLAAVPSIVFGLLGLAMFINFFGLPRSAPLVGGMVLALMTLPTIIIASRAALKAVPPSIREGALGHRHGAGAGRDGAAADDRHGRLHRRCAAWFH